MTCLCLLHLTCLSSFKKIVMLFVICVSDCLDVLERLYIFKTFRDFQYLCDCFGFGVVGCLGFVLLYLCRLEVRLYVVHVFVGFVRRLAE